MNHLLNCVLLVDDDPTTNYLNQYFLQKISFAKHIFQVSDGKDALDFILEKGKHQEPEEQCLLPDMIILDLNMVQMGGFEFLEAYSALPKSLNRAKVILLTTSDYRIDMNRAAQFPCVVEYLVKPIVLDAWRALALKYGRSIE